MNTNMKWLEADIRFNIDGDQWCCHYGDFINLQESPAGFGDTPGMALDDLLNKSVEEFK